MNRRDFLQAAFGTTFAALTGAKAALAQIEETLGRRGRELSPEELKDLLIWAPYEAFLPGDTATAPNDPNEGTENGVLKVADIQAGQPLTLKYWHGHGGVDHTFTITAAQLETLKSGHPVVLNLPTTVVEDHFHFAVIDPNRPA